MPQSLIYIAAVISAGWGVSHLVPTKNVVAGFGDIGANNRNIIAMEWIIEGVALIFIGALLTVVTYIDATSEVARAVYVVSIICLVSLAIVSFFTGFKVRFLPFRMCPFVLTASAVLVFIGLVM